MNVSSISSGEISADTRFGTVNLFEVLVVRSNIVAFPRYFLGEGLGQR